MNRKHLKLILQTALALFFIYILFGVDFSQLLETFELIPLPIWFLAVLLFLLTFVAQALRFYLLNLNFSFIRLFQVTVFHNFFLILLPFRLGEFSYIKQRTDAGVSIAKAAADIVVVRLYDLITLSVLFLILLLRFPGILGASAVLLLITLLILGAYILGLPANFHSNLVYLLKGVKGVSGLKRIILSLTAEMSTISLNHRLLLLIISILVWFCSLSPWVIFFSYILNLPVASGLLAVTVSLIASFIPINPPGGVGAVEAGWIAGFLLVGVSYGAAVTASVFAHAILVLGISLLTSFTFVFRETRRLISAR